MQCYTYLQFLFSDNFFFQHLLKSNIQNSSKDFWMDVKVRADNPSDFCTWFFLVTSTSSTVLVFTRVTPTLEGQSNTLQEDLETKEESHQKILGISECDRGRKSTPRVSATCTYQRPHHSGQQHIQSALQQAETILFRRLLFDFHIQGE